MPEGIRIYIKRLFFFSLGLYTRLFSHVIEYVERLNFIKYLYFLLIAADLYTVTLGLPVNHYIHLLVIFSGILTVFNYVFISVKKGKTDVCLKKRSFSFTHLTDYSLLSFKRLF